MQEYKAQPESKPRRFEESLTLVKTGVYDKFPVNLIEDEDGTLSEDFQAFVADPERWRREEVQDLCYSSGLYLAMCILEVANLTNSILLMMAEAAMRHFDLDIDQIVSWGSDLRTDDPSLLSSWEFLLFHCLKHVPLNDSLVQCIYSVYDESYAPYVTDTTCFILNILGEYDMLGHCHSVILDVVCDHISDALDNHSLAGVHILCIDSIFQFHHISEEEYGAFLCAVMELRERTDEVEEALYFVISNSLQDAPRDSRRRSLLEYIPLVDYMTNLKEQASYLGSNRIKERFCQIILLYFSNVYKEACKDGKDQGGRGEEVSETAGECDFKESLLFSELDLLVDVVIELDDLRAIVQLMKLLAQSSPSEYVYIPKAWKRLFSACGTDPHKQMVTKTLGFSPGY